MILLLLSNLRSEVEAVTKAAQFPVASQPQKLAFGRQKCNVNILSVRETTKKHVIVMSRFIFYYEYIVEEAPTYKLSF